MEGHKADRHVIISVGIARNDCMHVTVEVGEPSHERPHLLIVCVENVCTVQMDINAFCHLVAHIAAYVIAAFEYQTSQTFLSGSPCCDSSVKSAAYKLLCRNRMSPYMHYVLNHKQML